MLTAMRGGKPGDRGPILGKEADDPPFPRIRSSSEIFPALYLLIYLHTYFLTHSMVLLEKLTGLQLVKKFPTFHGTRRFITALKSVRHLSLS